MRGVDVDRGLFPSAYRAIVAVCALDGPIHSVSASRFSAMGRRLIRCADVLLIHLSECDRRQCSVCGRFGRGCDIHCVAVLFGHARCATGRVARFSARLVGAVANPTEVVHQATCWRHQLGWWANAIAGELISVRIETIRCAQPAADGESNLCVDVDVPSVSISCANPILSQQLKDMHVSFSSTLGHCAHDRSICCCIGSTGRA